MYEKLQKALTPTSRLLTGLVLFLVGLIWQIASDKTLDMYAFYFMSAAVLCVMNVLVCKMTKSDTDFILYLVLNMAVVIIGISLTASDSVSGTMMYGTWAICVAVDWIVNAVLIKCEILKRIVMGFVVTILNILAIGIVFIIPILISVFME